MCYKTESRVQLSFRVYRSEVKSPKIHLEGLSLKTVGIAAMVAKSSHSKPSSTTSPAPPETPSPFPKVAIIAGTGLSAQLVTPDVVKLVVSWEAFLMVFFLFLLTLEGTLEVCF